MSILIKNARIVSPGSKLHGSEKDILIKNGRIEKISNKISDKNARLISSENLHVSPGWLDIGTNGAEPGYEYRETFSSLSKSAAAGGFTGLAVFPNTNPPIDNKSSVQFVINNTKDEVVDFYPIGAISKSCKGKEITEMIDMAQHGAVAFSDGKHSINSNGVLLRALQYAKSTGCTIVHHPDDISLSNENNIHEGEVSTSLGLKGSPSLAEILTVERDILMAEYAESKILLHNLSCEESVNKLSILRSEQIFSSVSYLNLCKTDESLSSFDVNYKTNPPLRSDNDRKALIKGINQGTIDIICSNHVPLEEEAKKLEFVYAKLGATGLQTCFPALIEFAGKIKLDRLIECLSINPRRILGIEEIRIKTGEKANLTLFDTKCPWLFSEDNNYSKSRNSPFFDHQFPAKVLGIINGNKSRFN